MCNSNDDNIRKGTNKGESNLKIDGIVVTRGCFVAGAAAMLSPLDRTILLHSSIKMLRVSLFRLEWVSIDLEEITTCAATQIGQEVK